MPYKIQHLGLGGILDQAIAITRSHFGLLFSIMCVLLVPFGLLTGFATLAVMPELSGQPTQEEVQQMLEAQARYWPMFAIIGLVNAFIVLPLTNAAVISAVARLYLGQPVTAFDAYSHAMRRFLPLIGTTILMYLAIMGGLILFIIPGILFALWFGLSQHVVVIEETAGTTALGRSKKLTRPYLGTFIILGLILFIIFFALGLAVQMIPERNVQLVISTLLNAVGTIVATAAVVVYYFSCRCAVENFDLHYLAEQIGGEAPAVERDPAFDRATS